MKHHILHNAASDSNRRAILLFAGWGMDEKPFTGLNAEGYDIIIIWDYREGEPSAALRTSINRYEELCVIAWSFGVPMATEFIVNNPSLPVTARIAVNGTIRPVDDRFGIPTGIFKGTMDGLTEKSLSKFYLRMCGSNAKFKEFSENMPQRDVNELKDELKAIGERYQKPQLPRRDFTPWDCALVADADRIIPTGNQSQAWNESGSTIERLDIEGPHLPDFQKIIDTFITRKGKVAEKFARASASYDDNASTQHDIAAKLCSMLPSKANMALEIGGGIGHTTEMLLANSDIRKLEVWDLLAKTSEACIKQSDCQGAEILEKRYGDKTATLRVCDAETEIMKTPSGSIDLIFSASTVQWFNSLPSFLRHVARALRPGGEAIISTFGPQTMREIARTRNRHYPDLQAIGRMIPETCEIVKLEEDFMQMTFPSAIEALSHIKLTGVNALGGEKSAKDVREILRNYPTLPSGEAPLTYHPIYLHIKKAANNKIKKDQT